MTPRPGVRSDRTAREPGFTTEPEQRSEKDSVCTVLLVGARLSERRKKTHSGKNSTSYSKCRHTPSRGKGVMTYERSPRVWVK